MKCFDHSFLFIVLTVFFISVFSFTNTRSQNTVQQDQLLDKNTGFIENKGQIHDQDLKLRSDVLFSASVNGMMLFIKNDGISYQLYNTIISDEETSGHGPNPNLEDET